MAHREKPRPNASLNKPKDTPTLSNIRVRNSSQTSRGGKRKK